jgi:hypothetical protein
MIAAPLEKRFSGVVLGGQSEGGDGAGDCDFVFDRKEWKAQKGWSGVERRGERGCLHHAGAAAGLDEGHVVIPADFIFDANAAIELDEIGANTKKHVLAVVDDFSGAGMFVGRGASPEIRASLEECDLQAGIGEGASGGETSETSAGDGNRGSGEALDHTISLESGARCPRSESRFLSDPTDRFGMTKFRFDSCGAADMLM